MTQPVLVSYGGGTNSTAMLIELVERGEHVSAVLFADTGGERQETYDFVALFSEWLVQHGAPEITIVRHVRRDGTFQSLEEECLEKRCLPSIAYGFKKCSGKFKLEPQDKWTNHWTLAREAWARRDRIMKLVGFGIDEKRRADKGNTYQSDAWYERYRAGESTREIALSTLPPSPDYNQVRNAIRRVTEAVRYSKRYPLIEYGMDRDACVATITRRGIRLPGKSACWFCPSSKKPEIIALPMPLQLRAIAMERNAAATLTSVKGLGRSFSWESFLAGQQTPHQTEIEFPCECTDGDDD